ncbi:hypothetical protein MMC30_007052 [Trapelia coarctata]|nr:hypothetical protein [Trapelia coarctata]
MGMKIEFLVDTLSMFELTHHGRGTIYNQFGAYGSCGHIHPDSDFVAAISNTYMHGQGNNSPWCGQRIRATNVGSGDGVGGAGRSVEVLVADTCPSCGEGDVDFSQGAWDALTGGAASRWFWVEW